MEYKERNEEKMKTMIFILIGTTKSTFTLLKLQSQAKGSNINKTLKLKPLNFYDWILNSKKPSINFKRCLTLLSDN